MRFLVLTFLITATLLTKAQTNWNINLHPDLQNDEAIKVVLKDLQDAGSEFNISFTLKNSSGKPEGNTITVKVVEEPSEIINPVGNLSSDPRPGEDGYLINTFNIEGNTLIFVTGGNIIGAVYGLYRIWDRIRVFKEIPFMNEMREPELKIRVSPAWGHRGADGNTKEEIRNALRNGINWVSGPPVLDLIDWDVEPEKSNNAKTREKARELIEYAHSLHINFYSFAAEFTYHPSLLKKFGAILSPDDPKMWDALQEKYRMLFDAIPELDGIEICNDDISGFWGNYRPYDIMFDEND